MPNCLRTRLTVLLALAALLALADNARAQFDPCYCEYHAFFGIVNGKWESDGCNGPACLAGEGLCIIARTVEVGTDYEWCECTTAPAGPNCSCKGKVQNPNLEDKQLPPLIICETQTGCVVPGTSCSAAHLLPFPLVSTPICKCN